MCTRACNLLADSVVAFPSVNRAYRAARISVCCDWFSRSETGDKKLIPNHVNVLRHDTQISNEHIDQHSAENSSYI